MMAHSASLLFALATMAATADKDVTSFSHRQLSPGQTFEIQTVDRIYRGQLLDRATGKCQLISSADGEHFTAPSTVYLLGATGGEQERQMLVVMHQVKVGMKVELAVGDLNAEHRQITSEVKAIKLGG